MKKRLIKKITPSRGRTKYLYNNNFNFHLNSRLNWMKKFVSNNQNIIELGSGNGLVKIVLGKKVITTDIFNANWIDYKIDMNKMNLPKKYLNNVDVFIFNHSLHHSKNPYHVFKKCLKYLKKGGYILINDPEISFFFKLFLKICNHERWSLKNNDWQDNNATAHILFHRKKINSLFFKNYKVKKNDLAEFLIFLNSGGNGVDSPYLPLGNFFLKLLKKIDKLLIYLAPRIFALNRSVVLKKIL